LHCEVDLVGMPLGEFWEFDTYAKLTSALP